MIIRSTACMICTPTIADTAHQLQSRILKPCAICLSQATLQSCKSNMPVLVSNHNHPCPMSSLKKSLPMCKDECRQSLYTGSRSGWMAPQCQTTLLCQTPVESLSWKLLLHCMSTRQALSALLKARSCKWVNSLLGALAAALVSHAAYIKPDVDTFSDLRCNTFPVP